MSNRQSAGFRATPSPHPRQARNPAVSKEGPPAISEEGDLVRRIHTLIEEQAGELVRRIHGLIEEYGEDEFCAAAREATKKKSGRSRDLRPEHFDALLYLSIKTRQGRQSVVKACESLLREWREIENHADRLRSWQAIPELKSFDTGFTVGNLSRRYKEVKKRVQEGQLIIKFRNPVPEWTGCAPLSERLAALLFLSMRAKALGRAGRAETVVKLQRALDQFFLEYAHVERR